MKPKRDAKKRLKTQLFQMDLQLHQYLSFECTFNSFGLNEFFVKILRSQAWC